MIDYFANFSEAAVTALALFWKAGWAFVMGYFISSVVQVFVPKARLTKRMGGDDVKSISLSSIFGAASSSCSFAALAAARSLLLKGASFAATVAFMFASTNLVIELGILILIFLGWQFLVAEIIGGILLIIISTILIKLTYPKKLIEEAREKVEKDSPKQEDDFDWKEKIKKFENWYQVGDKFFGEWKMVWQEILIGFTIAGFVAVLVPDSFWKALFLVDETQQDGNFLIVLENAMIAPFVAGLTFIGSMGNIPLATVLNGGGVLFAGIMGFIYSDLMVPPLVKINAKYYGWKTAIYIAVIMYISIVITAVTLHYGFYLADKIPESEKVIDDIARFKIDYTFFLNIAAVIFIGFMTYLQRKFKQTKAGKEQGHMEMESSKLQLYIAYLAAFVVSIGFISSWFID